MIKVLTLFGTRPEAIKLAPVIKALHRRSNIFNSVVGVTGQHDELLQQVLDVFDIQPDFNLKLMKENQNIADLTATIIQVLGKTLKKIKPDMILVQGDTTTVFAAAIAAFYEKIKIGHVEAGLRTHDKYHPFPEEINRCLTDQMSDLLFAPTEQSRLNLIQSGIPEDRIHITGNTVIDALSTIVRTERSHKIEGLHQLNGKMILITAHRRESFGEPLKNVFTAVRELARTHRDFQFVYPVHPNPNVANSAHGMLDGIENVHLIPPVDYFDFIALMKAAYCILTDSGGVQEEAPSLHKPVLILRTKTERPEVVEAGGARLVGTDVRRIVREVKRLIENRQEYQRMASIENPYGDGKAAKKIVQTIEDHLGQLIG